MAPIVAHATIGAIHKIVPKNNLLTSEAKESAQLSSKRFDNYPPQATVKQWPRGGELSKRFGDILALSFASLVKRLF